MNGKKQEAITLTLKKAKILGAGILMAAFCLMAPQQMRAEEQKTQMDGVMGQSLDDETMYNRIRKTPLLGAAAYTSDFIDNSFTTSGDYTSATYYHNAQYADTEILNGIDVSWWQTKDKKTTALNWENVHDAGIDFAFVRTASRDTSNGKIYEDTAADSHIQAALANDINIGLYIFSQALTEAEAREEANYVLNQVEKYGWDVTLPIVIDREPGAHKRLTAGKLSKAKETAVDQAFIDTITEAGYRAALYTNYTWSRNYIDVNNLENCTIWFARYNNTTTSNAKSGSAYADIPCDYEFWQYSSKGKVDGYTGNLDVNFWYKDTSEQTTGLKAADGNAQTVNLSWDGVSSEDVSGYQVWRCAANDEKFTLLNTTSECNYADTTAEGGNVYQYKVRCYWTIGGTSYYGAFSPVASVTTLPKKVSGITTQTRKETSLELFWKQVQGADGYQIYQYNQADDQYEMAAEVEGDTTSYTFTGLAGATEYKFKIRAYEKNGDSLLTGSFSDVYCAVTNPAKVKSLKLSTKNAAVTVKWSKVSGATGYQIYRLNTKTGKYTKIAAVKGTSYQNTKLKKGATYRYKVRAYKTVNKKNYYGAFSSTAAMKVK